VSPVIGIDDPHANEHYCKKPWFLWRHWTVWMCPDCEELWRLEPPTWPDGGWEWARYDPKEKP